MIWYMTRSTWQLMQFKAGKKKWIISSVQWPGDVVPTWARVVHGLSTWNPDFNLTCGLVYKLKSRGRNFPTSVFPGFSYLLPDICLLWTPPNFLLFYFVIMRESAPTRMQLRLMLRGKMLFPLPSCPWKTRTLGEFWHNFSKLCSVDLVSPSLTHGTALSNSYHPSSLL